jgi:S1-C subfamily serine protease
MRGDFFRMEGAYTHLRQRRLYKDGVSELVYFYMFRLRICAAALFILMTAAVPIFAAQTKELAPTAPSAHGSAPTPVVPGSPAATVPPVTPGVALPGPIAPPAAVTAPGITPMPPSAPPQGTPLPEGSEPEKSVVQIINAFQEPDWSAPWIFGVPHFASGTGFLIDGNRIMTNAHVVAWTKQLLVRKYHDPQRYFAKVEFVGHDVDLAVLKIDDPNFYKGMKPLDFGPLPKVRSQVITYGFPAGGQQISYTRGVVSRIEVESYVHIGNRSFLAVQTDAAINPGNSGGPVIQDDKVVGVAFEGLPGLQSTGYFIPTLLIHHFLEDIKDGNYDGVPEAGLRLASLQNPAFRRMLNLPADSKRGVRIDQLLDIPTTKALLHPNDVIMQVGDFPVDDDGTITYEGNTVGVSVAFDMAQNNDTVPLRVWRDGKMIDVKLPMTVYTADYAQGNQYDVEPRYYIYGGLVFTTLSLDYLKTFGTDWSESAGRDLIYELAYRHTEDPAHWRAEPVVLASILDSAVNANFSVRGQAMIDKINGQRIDHLSDVPKAFAAGTGPDAVIDFMPDHHFEVMRKSDAEKATPDILDTYNVPAQSRL